MAGRLTPDRVGDRRTIGGRSVLALNGVASAVILGDCIRVQTPASRSFASIWLKPKSKTRTISYLWFIQLKSPLVKNVPVPTRETVPSTLWPSVDTRA